MKIDSEQAISLRKVIEASGEESWQWIEKSLTAHVPALSVTQINAIALKHWPVTVTQLIALTNCTIAEARAVIDGIEWD